MDRRKVIVVAAVLIAFVGAGVVFMYVKGADSRADQKFAAQQVLVAKESIAQGETLAAAQTAGKLETKSVSSGSVVPDAIATAGQIDSKQVALGPIYPGEQILTSNFGTPAVSTASTLQIPKGDIAISVQLDDTGKVAGFVNPGDKVAIFTGTGPNGASVLLAGVPVIAVGATTTIPTTTTDPSGTQTTSQVSSALFTLGLNQAEAEKVKGASTAGSLSFGLMNKDSVVTADAPAPAAAK